MLFELHECQNCEKELRSKWFVYGEHAGMMDEAIYKFCSPECVVEWIKND